PHEARVRKGDSGDSKERGCDCCCHTSIITTCKPVSQKYAKYGEESCFNSSPDRIGAKCRWYHQCINNPRWIIYANRCNIARRDQMSMHHCIVRHVKNVSLICIKFGRGQSIETQNCCYDENRVDFIRKKP